MSYYDYEYVAESKELKSGFKVEVVNDSDPENPVKNWDMVGTMVLIDRCRYNFGHESASYEELEEIADDPNNIVLPVYMYDHSGITIRTSPFSCPWDSGQVGVMYCTKQKAVKEFGKKIVTQKVREAAIKCMVAEVESIDDYLTGNVYGFRVYDPEGEEIDSCWGFFGDSKDCLESGLDSARYHERQLMEERRKNWRWALHEARENKYWAQRDVVSI